MSLPPPPPAPSRRPGRPVQPPLVRVVAALVVTTLAVGIGAVAVRLRDDGVDHPDAWDPRVQDLADYVERARGLEFDHPVQVDFLTAEEYTAETTTEVAELQAEELAELERGAAQLRALGVVSGPLDLAEVLNQTTDAATLAFYSPDDERIRIRGTDLTVGLRVTLVHELTHALQDQHFDLGELLEGDDSDSSASVARRALGEGDAMRIEDDYVATELSEEDQTAYDAESESDLEESEIAIAGIPPFIQASFAAPYALGAPFVQMLFNDGGNEAIDDAFEDPPSTEEHLFDPASFAAGEEAEDVDLDLDEDDVEIVDEGPFGSPSWFLVLGERLDPRVAFDAALGWGGDEYAVYERDDVTCIRAVFRGDTEDDEAQMGAALDEWAAALPGGQARRIDVDGRPGLDACDPGEDVDLQVTGRSLDLLILPNVWGYLEAEAVAQLGPEGARCFARRILDVVPYERLSDPDVDEELSEDIAQAGASAALECGSGDR
jgi:hypothetical protein